MSEIESKIKSVAVSAVNLTGGEDITPVISVDEEQKKNNKEIKQDLNNAVNSGTFGRSDAEKSFIRKFIEWLFGEGAEANKFNPVFSDHLGLNRMEMRKEVAESKDRVNAVAGKALSCMKGLDGFDGPGSELFTPDEKKLFAANRKAIENARQNAGFFESGTTFFGGFGLKGALADYDKAVEKLNKRSERFEKCRNEFVEKREKLSANETTLINAKNNALSLLEKYGQPSANPEKETFATLYKKLVNIREVGKDVAGKWIDDLYKDGVGLGGKARYWNYTDEARANALDDKLQRTQTHIKLSEEICEKMEKGESLTAFANRTNNKKINNYVNACTKLQRAKDKLLKLSGETVKKKQVVKINDRMALDEARKDSSAMLSLSSIESGKGGPLKPTTMTQKQPDIKARETKGLW
ncbi:MAG: hypothetical protein LBC92_01300 [Rickettsiales bacterium]|jgi:hypothetical protein|nr:hypothetical protein [Rickettsiales bacterium]